MEGAVVFRGLNQPRHHGGLGQIQIFSRLIKVGLGSGFNPVVIVAPVHLVEVHLQNFVFAEDLL